MEEYDFYKTDFIKFFHSGGVISIFTNFIHKLTEKKFSEKDYFEKVLDIGGNSGKHLEFIKHGFTEYYINDLLPYNLTPFALNYLNMGKLIRLTGNAENLEIPSDFFDRVIIVCVLHHTNNPEQLLIEAKRVLKPGGVLTIYLPCDPGIIYRILRKILTLNKKINGVEYDLINAREHKNHFHSLNIIINHVFKKDKVRKLKWPFLIFSWNFNLCAIFNIKVKNE